MSTEDFSHLAPEKKISHTVWKVRLQGYHELIQGFENSRSENDACFANLAAKPELLKSIATDANVVAQETGLLAVTKFLEMGANSEVVSKIKSQGLFVPSICEKGLSSSRAATKQHAISALLLLVEIDGSADWVVEQMTPYFSHKLPKLVAGCVTAMCAMAEAFGCKIVPAKLVLPLLAKLFSHADRNVRGEATKLAVEMRRWLGEPMDSVLMPSLKPVQQRDLKAEFDKIEGGAPVQKRLTRDQQAANAANAASVASGSEAGAEDVHMEDASDPMDLFEPVDVLSKMPSDLSASMASPKWKDRKDALEEVCAVLAKAPKLVVADYTGLVRIFAKCMKDANIQVVQLAANGVEYLCKGLRFEFHKYMALVLSPMLERSKEKKPAVADALANALDAIFAISSLSDVLDDTLEGMKHKTPQVKIAATNYLQRSLRDTSVAPKSAQIDMIMDVAVKLLTDSQEPIRQAATEMVGTLMKITGERELKGFLEKVDDNRVQKVRAVYETVSVKASVKKSTNTKTSASSAMGSVANSAPSLKESAIPSKRLATSPAKRDIKVSAKRDPKLPVKSFTGRQLISPSAPSLGRPEKENSPPDPTTVPISMHKETVNALEQENRQIRQELAQTQEKQSTFHAEITNLKEENASLSELLSSNQAEQNSAGLMLKQKDTQIVRMTSDLENAKLKIKALEQTIEMLKLQQSTAQVAPMLSYPDISRSPFKSPEKARTHVSSQELSSRVDRMSIEGKNSGDQPFSREAWDSWEPRESKETRVYTESAGEEENWRKAAEVTAQLKARIEKMKQRNRLSSR